MSPKISMAACLILLLSASVLTSVSFDQTTVHADQLEKEISEFDAEMVAEQMKSLKKLSEAGETPERADSFACTGGQNPSKLTFKQYINAFAAGPCTPLIVLAGISGTKLMVEIQCDTLKSKHPEIFSACGWDKCSKNPLDLISKVPKAEYRTWIPDLLAPMTVINPSNNQRKCFTGLMSITWQKNSAGVLFLRFRMFVKIFEGVGALVQVPVQGATIKPMGLSKETKTNSRCGYDSVCNLVPLGLLSPAIYNVYTKIRETLESRGYQIIFCGFGQY